LIPYNYTVLNISSTPFPTLTSHRLVLRKLVLRDAPALLQLRSDKSVNKYLDRPKTVTIAEAEAFVEKIDGLLANKESFYWAINLKERSTLVGAIGLWKFEPEKNLAEIGYELSPVCQGLGLMQEAIEQVIAYGFNTLQLKIITALPNPNNEKSVNLLKRNNFSIDTDYSYVSKEDAGEQVVYFLIADNN